MVDTLSLKKYYPLYFSWWNLPLDWSKKKKTWNDNFNFMKELYSLEESRDTKFSCLLDTQLIC